MQNIQQQAINTLRTLAADSIQAAGSGHPGLPLGAAPAAYTLWAKHLNINPAAPNWRGRDRFILSAGHGSALLYGLMHLFGFKVSLNDIKNFRQLNAITAGHPEYGYIEGIECTTGPLGQGLANAVGMAMAEKHKAALYNQDNYPIFNNYTYVLVGDGCLMEGISAEASSLAGTFGLNKLIILYDSNDTTIEGDTNLTFTEDVRARYAAYGFAAFLVEDGNDAEAIDKAITAAKASGKPGFIEVKTKIGYGSPREGSAKSHGEPLGEEGVKALKEKLGCPPDDFFIASEVKEHFKELMAGKAEAYNKWQANFEDYQKKYPELYSRLLKDEEPIGLDNLLTNQDLWNFPEERIATRTLSGQILNKLQNKYPQLWGGSADLGPSNKTILAGSPNFKENAAGRNIAYGVREQAMAAIANGIMLYGGSLSYVATFFVFSDYLKASLRLTALMKLPLIYIFTHDTIAVGEDGPTHQPIEQLVMLRATPNLLTYRPANGYEVMAGYALALSSRTRPTALILSRQNLPYLALQSPNALKGGYVAVDNEGFKAILLASGSELHLAIEAAKLLQSEHIPVRVVSMPSSELFLEQDAAYQEEVLPKSCRKRLAIEAGSSLSWAKLVGLDGDYLTMDRFGLSGKYKEVQKHFGFTAENVVNKVKKLLS
ncbi:MAG: transketolase [Spirochaetaceae bacterium]|nr:transketolase [Spirochaetaceae bacterium]